MEAPPRQQPPAAVEREERVEPDEAFEGPLRQGPLSPSPTEAPAPTPQQAPMEEEELE